MSQNLNNSGKINAKSTLKTGFRRTLGLLILFATVTLSSCTELLPFLDFFNK